MYIYQKNLENIIFHGEILKDFFLRTRMGEGCPFIYSYSTVLASVIWQEKN